LDYDPDTESGTWANLGDLVTTAGVTAVKDTTAVTLIGGIDAGTALKVEGKIYYAAAYANDTGTGTPAFEFYPQRDCTDFPMSPYLDFDGTDDRLETNIAPGSYDAGYLCGGWTQMEALGTFNSMFGSSSQNAVRGIRYSVTIQNTIRISGFNGSTEVSASTNPTITKDAPFVGTAAYTTTSIKARLNSGGEGTYLGANVYTGSAQVALLGCTNNTETSTVTPAGFMQGSMFSQIWLPSIPTDEQQAILRA
jgi:hypothetical protein